MTSTTAQWQRIVQLDHQPVLRNLLITQGYHELSHGFARMLGPENVTWFSFASWSSKTVGGYLQDHHLPSAVRARLEAAIPRFRLQLDLPFQRPALAVEPESSAGNRLDAAFAAAVHDMRCFLAKGNTEVFGELAPVFVGFLESFDHDREPDHSKLERFLSTLHEGDTAPDRVASDPGTRELALVARGGQALLREAVRHYYHAKFEADAKRKAERILLANAHIGVHEQTRLQTYIRAALDAPVRTLFTGAVQNVIAKRVGFGSAGPSASGERAQGPAAVARGASWVSVQAHSMFRRFATERLLTLKMPDSNVRLGRDLTAAPGHPLFPRMLEDIEHPELGSLFARYVSGPRALPPHVGEPPPPVPRRPRACASRVGPPRSVGASSVLDLDVPFVAGGASESIARAEGRLDHRALKRGQLTTALRASTTVARGTAAEDWASLEQRMRFILELFRSRQQNQRLLEPTFSESQVELLRRGMIPEGPLT